MSKYTKAIVASIGAAASAFAAAANDGQVTANEGWLIAVAFVTAISVYAFPNTDNGQNVLSSER